MQHTCSNIKRVGIARGVPERKYVVVRAQVNGELIDFALRERIDAHAVGHKWLPLPSPINSDQPILESLRVVVDRPTGLHACLGRFEDRKQVCPLLGRQHRDLLHRGDRHHGGAAALVLGVFSRGLIRHRCNIAHRIAYARMPPSKEALGPRHW